MNSIIVFDFDGTLYDISDVREMMYGIEADFLCEYAGMSRQKAYDFMIAERIITADSSEARSATECFQKMGIAPEIWTAYRTERFDVLCINPDKAVSLETLEGFSTFGELMLLSSNTLEVLYRIMKQINLSPDIFSNITCSDSAGRGKRFSKYAFFSSLIHDRNINVRDILSIGDRYMTDIYPLLQLGGRGVLLTYSPCLKTGDSSIYNVAC